MDNSLIIALGITVVGMTLLFLALGLFYGMLTLLTAVFGDRSPRPQAQAADEQAPDNLALESNMLLQAAAIAVALARAQGPTTMEALVASDETLSPWWSLHHQREVTRNPNVGRVP